MKLLRAICVLSALFMLACGGSSSKTDVAGIADTSVTADQAQTDQQLPPTDTGTDTAQPKDVAAEDSTVAEDKAAEDLGSDLSSDFSVEDVPGDIPVLDDQGDDLTDAGEEDAEQDQGPAKPTGSVVPPTDSTIYAHTPIVITFDPQMSNGSEAFVGTIIPGGKTPTANWDVIEGKDTMTIIPDGAWDIGDDMKLTVTVSAPDFPGLDYTVTLTYKVIPSLNNGDNCKGDKQCLNSICCETVNKCGGDSGGNCCSDTPDCSDDKWCDNSYLETYTCEDDRKPGEGCSRNEQCDGGSCKAGQCSECGNCPACPDGKQISCCGGFKCGCVTPPVCTTPPICPSIKCGLFVCTSDQFRCGVGCCAKGSTFCLLGACQAKLAYGQSCLYRNDACLSGICGKQTNTCACANNADCPVQSPTCNNGTCE